MRRHQQDWEWNPRAGALAATRKATPTITDEAAKSLCLFRRRLLRQTTTMTTGGQRRRIYPQWTESYPGMTAARPAARQPWDFLGSEALAATDPKGGARRPFPPPGSCHRHCRRRHCHYRRRRPLSPHPCASAGMGGAISTTPRRPCRPRTSPPIQRRTTWRRRPRRSSSSRSFRRHRRRDSRLLHRHRREAAEGEGAATNSS